MGIFFMPQSYAVSARQCVILLHGLALSNNSMEKISTYLQASNYLVVNQSYPSTKKSIKELADQYIPDMVTACLNYKPTQIHFVTYSLGGIILRKYMQDHQIPKLGRVVMLAPPNHGSRLADFLHGRFAKYIAGPASQELTTDKTSTPNQLTTSVKCQVGIIAGNISGNPLMKLIFREDNDGKVPVSSTRLNNMKDFIVLPISHKFMRDNHTVISEVIHFLTHGKFLQR